MADKKYPFTKAEFDAIYSRVPRLTVEIILKRDDGSIYLTKRAIEPCAGQWHLPGGTVYFGESLLEAAKRVASEEIGVEILEVHNNGYIEYPSHYLHGMDTPVGVVFEVTKFAGEPRVDDEATAGEWFTSLPDPTHADQDTFLVEHGYLTANT